jgi:hypothetical protein
MSRRAKLFFAAFLLWHLLMPFAGAVVTWQTGDYVPLSWQMYTQVPSDE